MWLFLALLAPLLFAIIHVIDHYCIEEVFDRPWIGSLAGSMTTLIVLTLVLPYALPFLDLQFGGLSIALLCIACGVMIQLSQYLYFQSLSQSEVGIVAAYWNMIPIMIAMGSFAILGRVLSPLHYAGIALLVTASSLLFLLDENAHFRRKTLILMIVACVFQAATYLLLDHIYTLIPFISAFILMSCGIIIAGMIPLLFRRARQILRSNAPLILKAGTMLLLVEVLNLAALFCAEKAIDLGIPSLVAAAETTIPAFTFVLSILLLILSNGRYGDRRSLLNIGSKVGAVFVMVVGVFLIGT